MTEKSLQDDALGHAIYCDCYIFKYKRYKVLGSITYEGFLEIMRNHDNKTVVQAHEFTLKCNSCGFSKSFKIRL